MAVAVVAVVVVVVVAGVVDVVVTGEVGVTVAGVVGVALAGLLGVAATAVVSLPPPPPPQADNKAPSTQATPHARVPAKHETAGDGVMGRLRSVRCAQDKGKSWRKCGTGPMPPRKGFFKNRVPRPIAVRKTQTLLF